MKTLSQAEIEHFKKHGFLVVRDLVEARTAADMPRWIDELVSMPLLPGKQMVYLEDRVLENGRKPVSRIEKFLDVHEKFDELARRSHVCRCMEQLLGGAAVIFKDKINFQPPGGGGILPHQDIQAGWLDYARDFVSVAITVDESTVDNGCTEIDVAWRSDGLVGKLWEPLDENTLKNIRFEKVPTEPGDAVFFDGFVPHRALPNQTDQYRRILFLTYNPSSQGEHYEAYYAAKRASYPPDNEREPGKTYVFRV